MIAGKMKVESSASSTTLTGMPRARAAAETAAFTARSSRGRDHRDGAFEDFRGEGGGAVR